MILLASDAAIDVQGREVALRAALRRRDAFRIELEKVGSGPSGSEGAKREGWMPTLVVVKV